MLIFNADTADEVRINSTAIAALLRREDGGTDIILTGGQGISVRSTIAAIREAMVTPVRKEVGEVKDTIVREPSPRG